MTSHKTINHVFLTGKKHVGKSTLLKKVLHNCSVPIGGFFTVRSCSYLQSIYTLHLLQASSALVPNASNFLAICGKPDKQTAQRFDQLGCEALTVNSNASLIVMDELGPHEGDAVLFRQTVLQTLNRDVPVIGVLQDSDAPFLKEIMQHPNVTVFLITEENRNDESLFHQILSIITSQIS